MENKNGGFIMAKIIKRAGIVFLVLVISLLLILGCMLAVNTATEDKNAVLQNNDGNIQETADKSYTLSGTCSQMAATWNTAIAYSKNNSAVNVNVTLGGNWTAQSDSTYTTSFGTGDGFSKGRILVPSGTKITLELNGYTINRNLTTAIKDGGVISVAGKFVLKDSYYTKEKALTLDSVAKIESTRIGKITGANISSQTEAALSIDGSNDCKIYGGVFYNNKLNYTPSSSFGFTASAIYNNGFANAYFFGGLVAFNSTIVNGAHKDNWRAAAVLVADYASSYLYDLIIKNNYGNIVAGYTYGDSHATKIGAGFQVFDNKLIDSEAESNFSDGFTILEPLDKDGKITRIGLTRAANTSISSNYNTHNNGVNPLKFFFSDNDDYIATVQNNNLMLCKKIESDKYDLMYYQNGYRKNYKDNNIIHGRDDFRLLENCGMSDYVLGNIMPNTSINTLISNINFAGSKVVIYNSKGQVVYNKGTATSGVDINNSILNAVGTGWRLETYSDSNLKIEMVYLSVLGDVNGDGRITASDISYLRQLASDKALFNNISVAKKLACTIDNRGGLSVVDGEILRLFIDKKIDLQNYL